MSVSIAIAPLSRSLDMFGPPDPTSAYSLSGHVSLSITSTLSLFDEPRPTRLLLESLELTFEGQSELVSAATGYTAVRLCSVSRELVSEGPLEISNEGHEHLEHGSQWDIVFDLPIPGWLPASCQFGEGCDALESGTQYFLYATARFREIPDGCHTFLSNICDIFRPKHRRMNASRCPIILTRYYTPSYSSSEHGRIPYFPRATYAVKTSIPRRSDPAARCIPEHLMAAIEVLAETPQRISITDIEFPLSIRVRSAHGLEETERAALKVESFSLNVLQNEEYRSSVCPEYRTYNPLPPLSQQPPNVPLRTPHPLENLLAFGLISPAESSLSCVRTMPLLAEGQSGQFKLSDDGISLGGEGWAKMEATVPLSKFMIREIGSDGQRTNTRPRHLIRPSSNSPLFKVSHELVVELTISYVNPSDSDSPQILREVLHFSLPLRFVATPSPALITSASVSPVGSRNPKSYPTIANLPAYSQLFYANGERRDDPELGQLPLYQKEYDGPILFNLERPWEITSLVPPTY
ncbi:hypothetical protein SISSUDRAFT_590270 [Sistotremastrum suecicum HHB10207 ss-3]|uniref:Arrestin-like N-terminal domain-containing protein n=1 Tax=Sistotremastrum suecicum HHB10207 ss-3 TaxID=1314776 RepID=A0A166ELS6_9AGAM|nr:hypothetical protein SISSUDRAFT_590270 [Sistotremastrum suecicum HHB10207 ss-3]